MDLKTYQRNAILTNNWRGNHPLLEQFKEAKATITIYEAPIVVCDADHEHWCLGLASELNEVMDAIRTMDTVNLEEELADIMWYAVNEATVWNFTIMAQTDVGVFGMTNLTHAVSMYIDDIKKINIYKRKVSETGDDIKVVNSINMEARLQKIITICYNFTACTGTFGDKVNLPQALTRNIEKLHKKRFPNGYSDEAANNRNLVEERKSLEGESNPA